MAIDLSLDEELSVWNSGQTSGAGEPPLISPKGPGFDVAALQLEHGHTLRMPPEGFVLAPWAFVLGWTAERIQLPHSSRLAARVEGRSSLARLGLGVHVTAPIIHAGFGHTDSSRQHPPWMIDFRLVIVVLLLVAAILFTWLTIDGLSSRRRLRMELAEISHVRYGLLNADRWREIIAPILDARIDTLDLKAQDRASLRIAKSVVQRMRAEAVEKFERKRRYFS